MPIEAIGEENDQYLDYSQPSISKWNGREVCPSPIFPESQKIALIFSHHNFSPPPMTDFKRDVIKLILDECDDISDQYDLPDQNQPDIILCGGFVRRAWKGTCRKVKRTGKEVKKGAKKVSSWVKEHKTVAIAGAIAVSVGAATPVVAAAAAAGGARKKEEDDDDSSDNKKSDPLKNREDPFTQPSSDLFASHVPHYPLQNGPITASSTEDPHLDRPSDNLTYRPWVNPMLPEFYPEKDPPIAPAPNLLSQTADAIKRTGIEAFGWLQSQVVRVGNLFSSNPENTGVRHGHEAGNRVFGGGLKEATPSQVFIIPGKQLQHGIIIGINGIGNSLKDAHSHAEYFSRLADGHQVTWVYNSSHSIPSDIGKAIACHHGHLSVEAKLLQKEWQKFHEENKNNSHAKCLVPCHSKGAIDVRNALLNSPQEIRDRVIAVAIAPAIVVSKNLCFDSFNYASKADPVPDIPARILSGLEGITPEQYITIYEELHKELILLDPHPDASHFDHEFQSPTFKRVLNEHIENHLAVEGYYEVPP